VQFLLFCLVASGSEYPCFLKSRIDFNHRRRFSFLHLFFGFWWPRGCSPSPIFCCRHNFLRCCCPARGPVLCSSPCFRVRSSPQFLLPAPGSAHISYFVRSLCKEFFLAPGPFSFISFFGAAGQCRSLLGLTVSFFLFHSVSRFDSDTQFLILLCQRLDSSALGS
jgi:hypothetical protein